MWIKEKERILEVGKPWRLLCSSWEIFTVASRLRKFVLELILETRLLQENSEFLFFLCLCMLIFIWGTVSHSQGCSWMMNYQGLSLQLSLLLPSLSKCWPRRHEPSCQLLGFLHFKYLLRNLGRQRNSD